HKHGLPMPVGLFTPTLFARYAGIGLPGMPRQGIVTLDASGSCLQGDAQDGLPVILGNLAELVAEPLPADGKQAWKARRLRTLKEQEADRFGAGFESPDIPRPPLKLPRPPLGPRPWREPKSYPAQEQTEYTLETPAGNVVVITKKYELKTQA